MEINEEQLRGKVERFGILCSKFQEAQAEKYKSYVKSLSWLINKSGYVCRSEVIIHNRVCSVCKKRLVGKQFNKAHRLPCDHLICSVDCLKDLILRCWREEGFDIGISICPTCLTPIFRDTLLEIFKSSRNLTLWLDQIMDDSLPEFDCEICYERHKITEAITLDCNHRFCSFGMKGLLESLINDNLVDNMACPQCGKAIDIYIIKNNVSENDWAKFNKFLLRNWKAENENGIDFRCPGVDCEFRGIIEDLATENLKCPSCQWEGCPRCLNETHKGITCEKFKQWKEENDKGEDELMKMAAENGWKKCPHCEAWCEKIRGCNFMTCGSATCKRKQYFCYLCGCKLEQKDHYDHFYKKPFGDKCRTLNPEGLKK